MGEVSSEFTEINRSRAKSVKDRLERMGIPVSLGQAYEVVAVAHGHRNWPVMKSAAPTIMPITSAVKEPVVPDRVEQLIAEFKNFVELRQKRFAPRNKVMAFGGTVEARRAFVDELARDLGLDVALIGPGAGVSEIDDVFSDSFRQRKLIFMDAVERLDVRKGGSGNHLCLCLDDTPPSQFVVLGAGRLDVVSLALLRRSQFRHSLD